MSISYVETALDGLVAFFISTLSTYTQAVDVEMNDGIVLPELDASKVSLGSVDDDRYRSNVNMFVVPDAGDVIDSGSTDNIQIPVKLYFTFRQANRDVLYRWAVRYIAAVQTMIRAEYNLGGICTFATFNTWEYYEALEADQGVKGVIITLTLNLRV